MTKRELLHRLESLDDYDTVGVVDTDGYTFDISRIVLTPEGDVKAVIIPDAPDLKDF